MFAIDEKENREELTNMDFATNALQTEQETLLTQLVQSRNRVLTLAQERRLDEGKLRQLANTEAELALTLRTMPDDPCARLVAAHAHARSYLERLIQHNPEHLVIADDIHSYTPRTILRRVLDHALDHLNQIDQWLIWQQQGTVPTPTDGWASSEDTMPEDFQPLSPKELQSWLWRIDLSLGMVANRAGQLSAQQLDWTPPDGGWSLRRTFYHLASTEIYYCVWLDEPLPDEPLARYREANTRLEQKLRQIFAAPDSEPARFFVDGAMIPAKEVAQMALTQEQALLSA